MIISRILIEAKNYIYILKNISNRLTVEFINQLSVIITLPIIANSLGINSFAIVSQGMILIHLILLISSWGIDGYSIERLNNSNDIKQRNLIINTFILTRLSLTLFFVIILFVFLKSNFIKLNLEYFWYMLFPIIASSFLPLWFFQAIGKPEKLLLPTLIGRFIFIILIFLFLKNDNSVNWFFISHGISSSIISLFGILILFKMDYKVKLINFKNIIYYLKESNNHFFLLIVNNQFNTLWATAIIFVGSSTSIAIFNLANQILKAGMGISELVGRVIRQSTYLKEINHLKKIIIIISFLYFLISIFFIYTLRDILKIFFISDYLLHIVIFQIIIVIWFFNAVFKLLSYSFITKILDIKKANKTSIRIGLIHVLFVFLWLVFSSSYNVFSISVYMMLACFFQFLTLVIYIKLAKKID